MAVPRKIKGPEYHVEEKKILAVVVVPFLHLLRVMPPVYIRGIEYVVENPAVHVDVTVGEKPDERRYRAEV